MGYKNLRKVSSSTVFRKKKNFFFCSLVGLDLRLLNDAWKKIQKKTVLGGDQG